ncbi:hypothetical protein GC207_15450 [bacterium]|nr:hypothetical protein [bacterium]
MTSGSQETVIALLVSLIGFGLLILVGGLIYQFLSLPYRRQERAQRFVDLLDTELKLGIAPEAAILHMAKCNDPSLSVPFYLLAAWLEKGLKLDEALDRVPRFLPGGVTAILKTGYQLGNLQQFIPACHYQLQAAADQVRKARNYFAGSLIIFFPAWTAIMWMISIFVIPKFNAIGAEMLPHYHPSWAITHINQLALFSLVPLAALLVVLVAYTAGPRIRLKLLHWLPPELVDGCLNWFPWNNRRARRDFSLALSLLLDCGVPEDQAVVHAASATGSFRFQQLAERTAAKLRDGVRFVDALAAVDPAGELKWRWEIAAQSGIPFREALEGWHETLNVRAVKAEQYASNYATTGLIVLNGVIVGAVVIGVFQFLTSIMQEASLW